MIAVVWTGIYYQSTSNSYLLGLLGIGAAWLVSVALRTVMGVARGARR
jgi:hypothetical protein